MVTFIPQNKAFAMNVLEMDSFKTTVSPLASLNLPPLFDHGVMIFYAKFIFIGHLIPFLAFGAWSFPWYVVEGIFNDILKFFMPPPQDADVLFNV